MGRIYADISAKATYGTHDPLNVSAGKSRKERQFFPLIVGL